MSRVGKCDVCGRPDLLGAISTGEEICPRCASVKFNVSEQFIAQELIKRSPIDVKDISAQIEELKNKEES